MTQEVIPFVEYTVTTPPEDTFVVPFIFWDKGDLIVRIDEVQTQDFNTTGEGEDTGGQVILVTPVSNAIVSIQRLVQTFRVVEFPIAGPFRIEQLNTEFDRVVAMINDQQYVFDSVQIDWDQIVNKPTEFPPEPHTHVEADIIGLDKYTKAEVDASQAVQDGRLTDIEAVNTTQDANISKNTTDIATNKTDIATNAANILLRTRWRDAWSDITTYEANDMVRDGSHLVVANTQNVNDKPITEEDATYPGESATYADQPLVSEEVYWTGQEYFIEDTWYIDGFRFYTPPGNFEFTVIYRVRNEDGTLQKVKQASAWQTYVTDGWKELTLPSFLLFEGQRLEIWLGTRAVPAAQSWSDTWDLKHDNSDPSRGEANFYSSGTELRVSNENESGVNQYNQLQQIQPGGQLSFGGDIWDVTAISNTGGTGGGGQHIFTLQPNQGRPKEDKYTFQWSWGATDSLLYVADPTFWQNNQNIKGSVGTEIVDDMTETVAQYGVDVLVRRVQLSQNWDIMSVSGVSGGGGSEEGGGARLFTDLIDTPANYTGEAGKVAVVNQTETGLEFVEGVGGQPVEIVEADTSAGWQVWGDVLIQWGQVQTNASGNSAFATFPQAFKTLPQVTVGPDNNNSNIVTFLIQNISETQFGALCYDIPNTAYRSRPCRWIAIGEAPDNLKKPKTVTSGGGGNIIQNFIELLDTPENYGTVGQIVAMASDGVSLEFIDNTGGGGGIGEAPQDGNYYTRRNAAWVDGNNVFLTETDGGALYAIKASEVPVGGTTGQVLKKTSNSDYAFSWQNESGGGGIPEAPNDGNYYARRNNAWANADDAFLTPAEGDAAYRAIGDATVDTFNGRQGAVTPAAGDYDNFYYTEAETNALLNDKVNSVPDITGSSKITNMVQLTQAEYDAGSPSANTMYVITDAT